MFTKYHDVIDNYNTYYIKYLKRIDKRYKSSPGHEESAVNGNQY